MDVDVNDDHVNDSKFALQAPFVCGCVTHLHEMCIFHFKIQATQLCFVSLFIFD